MTAKTSLYRTLLQDRQNLYLKTISDGIYTPFIYPWDTLPILFLGLGLLVSPRLPGFFNYTSRLVLTALSFIYCIARWPYVRTIGLTAGYGIGLSAFWGLIITVVLLVLHDPAKDFRRIEIRKKSTKDASEASGVHNSNDSLQNGSTAVRRRTGKSSQDSELSRIVERFDDVALVWQGYPTDSFHHLVDWSADLVTSFRGINWNFRIPLRTVILQPPEGDPPVLSTAARSRQKHVLRHLRYTAFCNFLIYYMIIDFLKTTLVSDPYFLGIAPLQSPPVWPWLTFLNSFLPGNIVLRFIRLSITMGSVVSALTFIFSLSPLFFATVLPYLLGEDLVYALTKSPLLEAWMYPPQWGNWISSICEKGLAGLWGTWWHQMFRFGISEPSKVLLQVRNISPRSQLGRALQLLIAFGLTASIHAVASSTTFSVVPSKPWEPFIFFLSQAIAIVVQTEVSKRLNKLVEFPKSVRQVANFVSFLVFGYFIGPYLADDFARCGIWLFEPVPISILRGLGFGPGDTWIPWLSPPKGGVWLGWWDGGIWYKSGIAIF